MPPTVASFIILIMLSSLSLRGAARAWCSAGARGVVSQAQRSALSTAAAGDFDIKRVGVVGMGLMGHGIAQSAAEAGLDVMAVDANADAVAAGEAAVRKSLGGSLGKQVAKGKLEQAAADARFEEVMGRFGTSSDLAAVADCDIVVEAIIEDLEIKKVTHRAAPFVVECTLARLTHAVVVAGVGGSRSGRTWAASCSRAPSSRPTRRRSASS